MRGKILFVVGLGAGYVVGTRSGRPAYDALVARLKRTSSDPRVQQATDKAKAAFESKAPAAAQAVEDAATTARGVAGAAKDAGSGDAPTDEGSSDQTAPEPSGSDEAVR